MKNPKPSYIAERRVWMSKHQKRFCRLTGYRPWWTPTRPMTIFYPLERSRWRFLNLDPGRQCPSNWLFNFLVALTTSILLAKSSFGAYFLFGTCYLLCLDCHSGRDVYARDERPVAGGNWRSFSAQSDWWKGIFRRAATTSVEVFGLNQNNEYHEPSLGISGEIFCWDRYWFWLRKRG